MNKPTGFNLVEHLHRQIAFSSETFGPGNRTEALLDHITKELTEIEQAPLDLVEWVDLVLLAFDGAWRAGFSPEQICTALHHKLDINIKRPWPDWKKCDPDKAIEHIRIDPIDTAT